MKHGIMTSKKSTIVIFLVIAVAVVFTLASYYKQRDRLDKETMLGGTVELLYQNTAPKRTEAKYIRANVKKGGVVEDYKVTLTVPTGPLDVNFRFISGKYPVKGNIKFAKGNMKGAFKSNRKGKAFGVAVNQVFLERARLNIGDTFKLGRNTYEVTRIIQSLPDTKGMSLMQEPLVLTRQHAQNGSNIARTKKSYEKRYLLYLPKMSATAWIENFKKANPQSPVIIRQWDKLD